jgi:pimeloyl-ACP methyl ester carboxylesterase
MSTLREFKITLADGIALSCAEQGDPSGRPVLLIHGYGDSWHSFRLLMAALPPSVRAIAVTMRGHGDSSKPAGGFGAAAFAADVAGVMDAVAVRRAVVVGHSMGSLVARQLAVKQADRVDALMLLGGFATLKGNEAAQALWRETIATMHDPVDTAFVRDFQQSTLGRPIPPEFFEVLVSECLKMPARAWRDVFRALLDEDHSDDLVRVAAPTTIVWGDQDAFTGRAEQDRLAREIPDARLNVYAGTGHSPHWEEPARVAADLLTLIAQDARRAA